MARGNWEKTTDDKGFTEWKIEDMNRAGIVEIVRQRLLSGEVEYQVNLRKGISIIESETVDTKEEAQTVADKWMRENPKGFKGAFQI